MSALATPASANVQNAFENAAPSVIVPVPVVAVLTLARLNSFGMVSAALRNRQHAIGAVEVDREAVAVGDRHSRAIIPPSDQLIVCRRVVVEHGIAKGRE